MIISIIMIIITIMIIIIIKIVILIIIIMIIIIIVIIIFQERQPPAWRQTASMAVLSGVLIFNVLIKRHHSLRKIIYIYFASTLFFDVLFDAFSS